MSIPRVAICAIGDEILEGRIVDTNSAWIAQTVSAFGFQVSQMSIISDDEDGIVTAIEQAASAADLVLLTGGLGPTEDDRTRHALARASNRVLQHNDRAWKQIETFFRRRFPDRVIVESNKRQALMPKGARILRNDRGTAPGLSLRIGASMVACFPGVPHEMKSMVERALPQLAKHIASWKQPYTESASFAGIGESRVQEELGALLGGTNPRMGITAQESGHICIRATGSKSTASKRMGKIRRILRDSLLPEENLAASVVASCGKRGWTLSAAESCTCGAVIQAIGSIAGASAVVRESIITYHNDSKEQRLGVSADMLQREGAVSEAVVAAMATGVAQWSGATIGMATSGIAGPDGGSKNKPVGTVWLAVSVKGKVVTQLVHISGTRQRVQERAAAMCLLLAWETLQGR